MLDAADWTLPDPPHDDPPHDDPPHDDLPHDDPPACGEPRRAPYRLLALAAVAVAALVTAVVLLPGWGTPTGKGTQPGSTPTRTGTAETVTPARTGTAEAVAPAAGASSGGIPAGTAGRAVSLGTRVPPTGTVALGVGEVHRYDLVLADGDGLYLQGEADCGAHLLPWTLVRRGGGTVAAANLTCERYGPLQLAAGGYELRIGGPGVEGSYALRLIRA
jgi:hypothetical protein